MIIKNNEKEYTISFFPSDKDGLGLAYENHTLPDAPKKAFIKILIAAGFLGVISAFVFTPPADEYSASADAALAAPEVNGYSSLAGVTTPAPEVKSGALMPSFASKALTALTSSKPAEPEKETYITTESRTVTLSPDATTASKEIILKVNPGDNIVTMMKRQGISNAEANRAATVLGKIYDLKKVRPGQTVTIVKNEGLFSVTLRDKDYNKFSASTIVILDGVTDPHNIGAILRSMAAFDSQALIVTDKNAPSETAAMAKAASGALDIVPLIRITNLARALEQLKQAGFWIVGMEGTAEKSLRELDIPKKIAIVMGSEGEGMRRLTLQSCDFLAKLPISPKMESLNVSNAAAIALYELSYKLKA